MAAEVAKALLDLGQELAQADDLGLEPVREILRGVLVGLKEDLLALVGRHGLRIVKERAAARAGGPCPERHPRPRRGSRRDLPRRRGARPRALLIEQGDEWLVSRRYLSQAAVGLLLSISLLFGSSAAGDAPPLAERPGVGGDHDVTTAAAPRRIGSGAWSYFADPRAVYAGGKTFVGWADARGYTHVAALDVSRGVVHRKLSPRLSVNDHNNPSLYVRPDGRIMVFYSAHNGRQMYYRTSARRYSLSRLSAPRVVGTNTGGSWGYTYPNPLRADGKLWLMFRGGNWQPNFTILERGGWTRARTLARGPVGRTRKGAPLARGGRHRPYTKYATDGERIHATFTEGNLGAYPNAIYYAQFDRTGIRTASGRRIARLGSAPPVQKLDRVRAFRGRNQWALDIAVDHQGRPVIVYTRRAPRVEYWWARFNGRRWENRLIARYVGPPAGPGAVGGVTLDHEDPSVVYLARTTSDARRHEVEVWATPDEGRRWRNYRVTSTPNTDDLRPVSPRGLEDFEQVVWFAGRRTFWTSFKTNILTTMLRAPWPSSQWSAREFHG
jgi:hypothetical protein